MFTSFHLCNVKLGFPEILKKSYTLSLTEYAFQNNASLDTLNHSLFTGYLV